MRCAGLNLRCPPGVLARRVEADGVCGWGHGGWVVGMPIPPAATAAAAGSSTTSKPSSSLPRLLVEGGAVAGRYDGGAFLVKVGAQVTLLGTRTPPLSLNLA